MTDQSSGLKGLSEFRARNGTVFYYDADLDNVKIKFPISKQELISQTEMTIPVNPEDLMEFLGLMLKAAYLEEVESMSPDDFMEKLLEKAGASLITSD